MAIMAGVDDARHLEWLDAGLCQELTTIAPVGRHIYPLCTVVLVTHSLGTPSSQAASESGG